MNNLKNLKDLKNLKNKHYTGKGMHTLPTKINFCQPIVRLQQNIFEQTLIEVGSLNIYASFDTFCIQISQCLESQLAFEECLNIDKSLFSSF